MSGSEFIILIWQLFLNIHINNTRLLSSGKLRVPSSAHSFWCLSLSINTRVEVLHTITYSSVFSLLSSNFLLVSPRSLRVKSILLLNSVFHAAATLSLLFFCSILFYGVGFHSAGSF